MYLIDRAFVWRCKVCRLFIRFPSPTVTAWLMLDPRSESSQVLEDIPFFLRCVGRRFCQRLIWVKPRFPAGAMRICRGLQLAILKDRTSADSGSVVVKESQKQGQEWQYVFRREDSHRHGPGSSLLSFKRM